MSETSTAGDGVRTDAEDLPYKDRSVTFLRVVNGQIEACGYVSTKREWLAGQKKLWAAWTGRYKTDVFVLDRKAAREALK